MPESSTRLRDLPHYKITANELAKWLEGQDEMSWWSIDGDPLLTQRLDFPCSGVDIAAEFRRLGKPLLVLDTRDRPIASSENILSEQLDSVAHTGHSGDRVFQFCWEDGPDADWLLVEDTETSESSLGLDDNEE